MAPIVHLVRHAQGYHNLDISGQQLRDPDLTALGERQCDELRAAFPFHAQLTHLAASPIRRTLQTCLRGFHHHHHHHASSSSSSSCAKDKDDLPVVALPDAQEVSALPCDTGVDAAALRAEFSEDQVDLALVGPAWNVKTPGSPYFPSPENLEARARRCRLWMRGLARAYAEQQGRDEAQIVLVTHGGFLHFLTEDWDGVKLDHAGTGWANAEFRSYEFADASGADPDAALRETRASARRRRGSAISLTPTEQLQLREAFQASLANELRKHERAGKSPVVSDEKAA
ncbi:phosphoglycerate mutase-like protein [Xylariomycetidae sp. FL0641]|nr:phosphoglycerate mutase-like protein [Xylariomycetidae sp. FL0641]